MFTSVEALSERQYKNRASLSLSLSLSVCASVCVAAQKTVRESRFDFSKQTRANDKLSLFGG